MLQMCIIEILQWSFLYSTFQPLRQICNDTISS